MQRSNGGFLVRLWRSLACLALTCAALPAAEPLVFAHRGLHAVAPENTMAAFEACVANGLSIELDVYLSSDGVPVVIHDGTLERTTNGRGRVTSTPWSALSALDAGSWYDAKFASQRIPTFEQTLAMIRDKDRARAVHVAINMKEISPGIEEKVVRLVEKHGLLDRVFAFGMDEESLARYKAANPSFPVCRRAASKQEILEQGAKAGAEWIWISAADSLNPDRAEIAPAQKAGKRLIIYLQKNEPERWLRARLGRGRHLYRLPLEASGPAERSMMNRREWIASPAAPPWPPVPPVRRQRRSRPPGLLTPTASTASTAASSTPMCTSGHRTWLRFRCRLERTRPP